MNMNNIEGDGEELYLEHSVRGILEGLLFNVIKHKPEEPMPYMIQWLKSYIGAGDPNNNCKGGSEIEELMALRKEIKIYKRRYPNLCNEDDDDVLDSDKDNNEKDKDDNEVKVNNTAVQRISVSAEVYGIYNKIEDFVPTIIPKSNEQKERIKTKMLSNFLFNQLDEKELMTVIDCFEEKAIEANDIIIKEGDKGDILYLLDSGEAYCYKKRSNGSNGYLKTYIAGESFGELALMYNAPRAATIITKTDCIVWLLERNCFNAIIKSAAIARRKANEKVLRSVELFQTMNEYEIGQICDALRTEKVKAETKIIEENDEGNTFFILEEGEAYATKTNNDKDKYKEQVVLTYTKGSYFGELALLHNKPRAANVYAKTDCKVLTLDRMSFKRLLGSLEAILTRNSDTYIKYQPNL